MTIAPSLVVAIVAADFVLVAAASFVGVLLADAWVRRRKLRALRGALGDRVFVYPDRPGDPPS